VKKLILIPALLVLIQQFSLAQKKGKELRDSLFTVIEAAKGDPAEVSALNALAFEFRNNNPDTSIYYSKKAIVLATSLDDKPGAADAYLNMGSATVNLGNYEEAQKNISESINIYDELLSDPTPDSSKFFKQKARAYSIKGNTWYNQGNFPEALKNYFVSLNIREEIGDKAGVAAVYNNIASVRVEEGNYPEALKNNLTALRIREELDDKDGIATSYNNIGNAYDGMGNYPEALKMHFAALEIRKEIGYKKGIADSYNNIGGIYASLGKFEEALPNHLAALEIRLEIGDKLGVATSYINIGSVDMKQNKFDDALKNYFTALKIAEEIGDKENLSYVLINIGNVYISQMKTADASKFLNRGLAIAKEIYSLDHTRSAFAALAQLDSIQGNFKQSLMHYKLYIAYRDSLFNEDNTRKAVQAQMQYDFDKKESLAKAEQENRDALTSAEISRQKLVRNFSVIGAFGILAVGGYVFYNFRKRKKLENEQALTGERLRISRELHDDIGSTLGSIAVYSDVARNRSQKNENPVEVLSKIGNASRELIEKMSDIVWSLNPDNETFEQLQNRMQTFASMILVPRGIQVDFKPDPELKAVQLNNEQRKNIFLIYKEAVHNIAKYADCKTVSIVLTRSGGNLALSIRDDGKGFDPQSFENGSIEAYNGNGLKNMKARAIEINAVMNIKSSKNKGTAIELVLNS